MHAAIELYTDGAFRFSKTPGYGWVAKVEGDVVAEGHGPVRNDGTNNCAAEIWAALEALRFAIARGFRRIVLHTDFETLHLHFRRTPKHPDRIAATAHQWLLEHRDIELEFVKVPSSHPLLHRAHDLSRAAVA